MKYRYLGEEELHLPTLGITVKKGDVIETKNELNHPEFKPEKEEKVKK